MTKSLLTFIVACLVALASVVLISPIVVLIRDVYAVSPSFSIHELQDTSNNTLALTRSGYQHINGSLAQTLGHLLDGVPKEFE